MPSACHLRTLSERRLDREEFVAAVLDGKTFADDARVMALGITRQGQKTILGFVQTATENERVCAAFLQELVARGLRAESGLLCIIDGAKGLSKELRLLNTSAAASLDEGCEETLTLHRLRLFQALGVSLKTRNCLESLNAQLGQVTAKVDW